MCWPHSSVIAIRLTPSESDTKFLSDYAVDSLHPLQSPHSHVTDLPPKGLPIRESWMTDAPTIRIGRRMVHVRFGSVAAILA